MLLQAALIIPTVPIVKMVNNPFSKIHTAIVMLIICTCLLGAYHPAIADTAPGYKSDQAPEPADEQRPGMSVSTIYAYDEKNPPEFFFFPKEKARWDGSKVSMSEWYMLTELQKEKFITEYFTQLQKQNNITIDVTDMDYLKALNVFSVYSNTRSMNEPSTKFIDILLSGQGKISAKGHVSEGTTR